MTKQLTKAEQAVQIYSEIEKAQLPLPAHIKSDHFVKMVKAAIAQQPALIACTPRSILMACTKAASDGLLLDGREATLQVRNVKVKVRGQPDQWEKQAVYIPMYQGLMKLARNSGQIASITAEVVYENDVFRHIKGEEEKIIHEPCGLLEDQGQPIAVYAIVKLRDGTVVREVMRRSQIMNIAAQGGNAKQYDPDEGRNYAEWWRKTVIRRVTKYIPRSSDRHGQAFEQAVETIDGDYEWKDGAGTKAPLPKPRGGAARALAAPQQQPDPEPEDPPAEDAGDEPGGDPDDDYIDGEVVDDNEQE